MAGLIRAFVLFVAGMIVGIFMMQSGSAQSGTTQSGDRGLKLNHVGIAVKNFDEELNFYTKTLGFREAFMVRDPQGKPFLAYVQISRDTFLELQPANAERPAGLSHIGIQANDVKSMVPLLRQRSVKIEDSRLGSTKAPLTNFFDPEGSRLELVELAPESLQRKAVDAWK